MMKKLLLGLVAVFFASSVSAQLALKEQTVKSPITQVKSSMVSNLFGNKADNKQVKNQVNVNRNGKHIWADANTLGKSAVNALPLKNSAMAKASAATRAGETAYTWWGHITSQSQQLYAIGFSTLASEFSLDWMNGQTEYNVACIVPSMYANAKVDSVQLLLTAAQYKDLKIWVSDVNILEQDGQQYLDIPESADEADYSYTVPAADIPTAASGYVARLTVKLPESFKIGSNGCFVGYSFTGAADDKPIVAAENLSTVDTGSFLWQYEENGTRYFEDLSSSQSLNMSLSTIVGLDLSDCEANNASVEGSAETTALIGKESTSTFYVVNNGAKTINSISYVLEVDGETSGEKTQTLSNPIEAGSYGILTYPAKFSDEGLHSINCTITKVNGNDNIAETIDASNVIVALEKGADRVNVVEQLTGTWDGYSPRGIVAFNNLNRDLGDKVITMACHYNYDSSTLDPMNMFNAQDVTDYGYVMYVLSSQLGGPSFPGALFNRTAFADSYVGSTQDVNSKGTYDYGATNLVKLLDEYYPSEADMKMTASWADESKEGINVDVKTTFSYDRIGEFPYGIGFLLVENGMTGTAGSWRQQNSYNDVLGDATAAYFKNDDMSNWFNASSKVRTSYDNVVVQAVEPVGRLAIAESDNSDVVKGQTYDWNNVIGLSSDLIQDKEQLSLVAVLVNLKSYAIVNAARVFLGNKAAGIEDVNTEANNSVVSRFNLNGMNINAPQKGINLVKTADGKVKKFVVRK